jgi:hypothetical protein
LYETNSVRGVIRATACALGVASVPTGLGLAAAVAACLLMFYPVE